MKKNRLWYISYHWKCNSIQQGFNAIGIELESYENLSKSELDYIKRRIMRNHSGLPDITILNFAELRY